MTTPFPGMDPYLEHPAIWPDVHNSLIAALRDDLSERIAPEYFVGLEERVYELHPGESLSIGRPDLVLSSTSASEAVSLARGPAGPAVLDVEVPIPDEARETFLEIRNVKAKRLVTVVEILSPANKRKGRGRRIYQKKRRRILESQTSLVEIDLLRAGEPMPVVSPACRSDYRILVSRGRDRPRAQLYPFTMRQPIPTFPVPLQPGEEELPVDLGALLHALYRRARYHLVLNYDGTAVPPLDEAEADWANRLRSG